MLSRTLLCVSIASVSSPLLADTVWMKNGDRLTGTIQVFDGGKLVLKTEYGGSIPLDWKKIATLESKHDLLVRQESERDLNGQLVQKMQPADPGKVTVSTGTEAPKTVELASIEQILTPKPLIQDLVWKGDIDVSLDYKRAEKDTDDYDVDFKTSARHGLWRHNGKGEYNREFQDDVKTTDNWSAEYALDRFLDEHWFWQGRAEYKTDKIEELRRQRTLGTGPGYQFWDNELGAFSLTTLLNRTDHEYESGNKENFYALGVKWDYNRYLIGKAFELFTNGEVGKPLGNVADYTLDAELGLRYKVTEWASLNMKAEKDLVSGAEGDLDETRYSVGFGVGW
ncbi:DUF481 domain-containing protein [Pseudomonas sp. RIT-PI-AD]|uniref:DUF481 domain-containing protein n=1 Tax=Pseudomonas sp. RIT-PI-AD TaxID=3035294 RepID=UPI0021D8BC0E|nr:DUF481 domain-containing protein [Pseudomonas sp. RIT-PI-AD]